MDAVVRELLDEAAWFAREGDVTAATSRAKAAVRASTDPVSLGESRLALERMLADERSWRDDIEARSHGDPHAEHRKGEAE